MSMPRQETAKLTGQHTIDVQRRGMRVVRMGQEGGSRSCPTVFYANNAHVTGRRGSVILMDPP
jgi:hypothetical protein